MIIEGLIAEKERLEKQLLDGKGVEDFAKYKYLTGIICGLAKAQQVVDEALKKDAEREY